MKKLIIILVLAYSYAKGQEFDPQMPQLGKPCPSFTFSDVRNYKKKSVTIADFKGKWLILDCWNRYCAICLNKMPHIDSLQKQFNEDVKFVLVGYTGSQYTKRSDHKQIKKIYERNRKELNLNLTIAFDSVLFHQFKIGPCPYIIIVDPEGVVRGLANNLTAVQLKELMQGKPVLFDKVYNRKKSYITN